MPTKWTDEIVKERLEKHNLILVSNFTIARDRHIILCHCGKHYITRIQSILVGKSLSCGCSSKYNKYPICIIGHKFGLLEVIELSFKKHKRWYWKCKCECGRVKDISSHELKNGDTKTCGCGKVNRCKDRLIDISGYKQPNGKLTVIELSDRIKVGGIERGRWKCICDCGNYINLPKYHILSDHTSSCGKCNNFVNGKKTSFVAKKLHNNLIKYGYNTSLENNHNVKTNSGFYIDITIPDINIAIEYDSAKYHKNKLQKDLDRVQTLIQEGWKVLTIRSDGNNLPNIEEINIAITKLLNDEEHIIIQMESWNKCERY